MFIVYIVSYISFIVAANWNYDLALQIIWKKINIIIMGKYFFRSVEYVKTMMQFRMLLIPDFLSGNGSTGIIWQE